MRRTQMVVLLIIAALTLVSCSSTQGGPGAQAGSGASATSAPAVAGASPVPPPASTSTAGQGSGATPSPGSSQAASNDPTTAAIEAVIQKADQEQQDAFAKNDPTIMQDTSTSSYYTELVQTNNDMANGGVKAIKLVKIDWGQVQLTNPTTAQANDYETWQTTYSDGSSDQAKELNVYTLVQQQGTWKIQTDDHPNSNRGNAAAPTSSRPSGAAPSPQPTAAVPTAVSTPGPGANTSRNWAGYASSSGKFTAITGTWTVPQALASGSAGTDATWVGIGGVDTRDLIQSGTEETTSRNGTVQWDAWIEMLPQASQQVPLGIKAGDSVTVTITQQNAGQWLIQLSNNTTGESYQRTVQYRSSLSSAEWIEEAPAAGGRGGVRILPLDNFGTVQFSGGTTDQDGKNVTIQQSGAKPITLSDARGNALVTPSGLTPDGKGFTVSRAGSAATP